MKTGAKIVVIVALAGGIFCGCNKPDAAPGSPVPQPATQAVTVKTYTHGRCEAQVLTWRGESAVTVTVDGNVVFRQAFFSNSGQHGDYIMDGTWSPDGKHFAFKLASSAGHQPYRSPVKILKIDGAGSALIDAENVIRKLPGTSITAVGHEEEPYMAWLSDIELQVSTLSDDMQHSEMYAINVATLKARKVEKQ